MLVPRCGTAAVSFLPQNPRFPAYFWAVRRACRISATLPPSGGRKYGSAVNIPVMKRLPESS
jgi:hypothetical protein